MNKTNDDDDDTHEAEKIEPRKKLTPRHPNFPTHPHTHSLSIPAQSIMDESTPDTPPHHSPRSPPQQQQQQQPQAFYSLSPSSRPTSQSLPEYQPSASKPQAPLA